MTRDNNKTRREFLEDTLRTGSIAAVGGLVCLGLPRGAGALSREYRDKLEAMAHIDPEWIQYEEVEEPIPTGMSEPRAVAADASGNLYLAGDQTVQIIAPGNRKIERLKLDDSPCCLAPAEKEIFIGTRDRVVVAGRNGEVKARWPSLGESAWITGIAFDGEHVFIADAGESIVWCFDRTGLFIRRIGEKDPDRKSGFVVPGPYFTLAMGPDGLLRVANPGRHRIEAYTVRGDLEFSWGRFGNSLEDFTACCNPVSFDILTDGSVVTCEKGLSRIKVYDSFGTLTGVVAGPQQLTGGVQAIAQKAEQRQHYGFDVAADEKGRVFVLDRVRNAVRIFSRKEIDMG